MQIEEKLAVVRRNTEEIVTLDELTLLITGKKNPSAYVGYEPSGKIHLGHMLTAEKLLDMQNAGFKVKVLLADLHAYLNQKGSLEEIRKIAEFNKECFVGMGLHPSKTEFILGSDVQLGKEYFMNVQRLALETTLQRARRSMDLVGRADKDPKVARVMYPIMQVIDMVALDVDVAVGGMDQRKIHMLARDNLSKLGFRAPVCIHTPIIHGLDGSDKMSSSKMNFISVDDSETEIKSKLNKAYCPIGQMENNPVLEMYKNYIFPKFRDVTIERQAKFGGDMSFKTYEELEQCYRDEKMHPQDLKNTAALYMSRILAPVREHLEKKGYIAKQDPLASTSGRSKQAIPNGNM